MESRLLERPVLFTMLGAIFSSCQVSLLRKICLCLLDLYLDYQVYLVLILLSVKLTKAGISCIRQLCDIFG